MAREYPNAEIIDVTSRGPEPWVRFSQFFPLGEIPVPYSPEYVSQSVEGLWQGLKVFEQHDVDISKFEITGMKGLKRTVRKFGNVLGHRKGVHGELLLEYVDARRLIYLPSYYFALTKKLQSEIGVLQHLRRNKVLVLLDYEINSDIEDTRKPLSHAGLIAKYLMENEPD